MAIKRHKPEEIVSKLRQLDLLVGHGCDMPVPEIGQRSRCTECGAKGGSVQVVAVQW